MAWLLVVGLAGAVDHRPAFHAMPGRWFTNDIDGPFYHAGWYHLLFAYHENRTCFCNDGPGANQWYHVVSRDLARWHRLAPALRPGGSYDRTAVMTGSTTLVDGRPVILFSSSPGDGISAARPADGDPLCRTWEKDSRNPLFFQFSFPVSKKIHSRRLFTEID